MPCKNNQTQDRLSKSPIMISHTVHHRGQHGKAGVLPARAGALVVPLTDDVCVVINVELRVAVRCLALPEPHTSVLVQNVAIQLTARAVATVAERDTRVQKHFNLIDRESARDHGRSHEHMGLGMPSHEGVHGDVVFLGKRWDVLAHVVQREAIHSANQERAAEFRPVLLVGCWRLKQRAIQESTLPKIKFGTLVKRQLLGTHEALATKEGHTNRGARVGVLNPCLQH